MQKHIVIDACCLGRRKTGNETYIRGLLKGFEEVLRDGRPSVLPPSSLSSLQQSAIANRQLSSLRFTILTTEAYTGEKSNCFDWVNIPLGNFLTRNFLTIPRLLRKLKADVFHASYWFRFWAPPCPTVLMVHDLSFVSFPQGFHKHEQIVYSQLVRLCAQAATQIVTVSEFSKREIMTHWRIPSKKINVTYNGIDKVFRPAAGRNHSSLETENQKSKAEQSETDCRKQPTGRVIESIKNQQLEIENPSPYLLYVGNLHPRKNLVRLLEAFILLKRELAIPHVLKIVGQSAWLSGEVFAAVRDSGMEKSVEFTGYVDQDQLVTLYQQADVTVYPSLYEGFGLPPLEAMACGCPVVTSQSTSLPEVTGGHAVLVDPLSPVAIAKGIQRLLESDALRDELSAAGLAQTAAFTWPQCAAKTLAVYSAIENKS